MCALGLLAAAALGAGCAAAAKAAAGLEGTWKSSNGRTVYVCASRVRESKYFIGYSYEAVADLLSGFAVAEWSDAANTLSGTYYHLPMARSAFTLHAAGASFVGGAGAVFDLASQTNTTVPDDHQCARPYEKGGGHTAAGWWHDTQGITEKAVCPPGPSLVTAFGAGGGCLFHVPGQANFTCVYATGGFVDSSFALWHNTWQTEDGRTKGSQIGILLAPSHFLEIYQSPDQSAWSGAAPGGYVWYEVRSDAIPKQFCP